MTTATNAQYQQPSQGPIAPNPYAAPGQQLAPNPYGQQPAPNPYGQQPPPNQYGQQPPPNQYGQQPPPNQYGQQPPPNQYGQQPPPGCTNYLIFCNFFVFGGNMAYLVISPSR